MTVQQERKKLWFLRNLAVSGGGRQEVYTIY